jgi:hypothetical protein
MTQADAREGVQKKLAIGVIFKNRFSFVTSGGYMVQCAVEFDPEWTGLESSDDSSK